MSEIDTYRIYYYSAPQYSWDVRVDLFSATGLTLAMLYFIKAGKTVPPNQYLANGVPKIHFSSEHLSEIIALLRYEKPLYVNLVASNGIGFIGTGYEPVGEQEGT